MEAVIGHTHIRSYPDDIIEAAGDVVTSDAISGIQGAFAVCMALRHVRRTGRGQLLEQPLAEAFLPIIGRVPARLHRQRPRHRAARQPPPHPTPPHNYYPCREDGDYIAIDCDSDEAWEAILRGARRRRSAGQRGVDDGRGPLTAIRTRSTGRSASTPAGTTSARCSSASRPRA